MANDVGRPSHLDNPETLLKIKELTLDGYNMKSVSEILEIPYKTMERWMYENYEGFADKLISYKHERILRKAEANLEQLLEGEDEKIRADLTKFALETLNKKHYSKRNEMTGAEGKELKISFDNAFNATPSSTTGNS